MQIDWSPLRSELALWRRSSQELPIWWRDDDAIAATPALDRLATISTETALPIHVAVIPHDITPSLPTLMMQDTMLIPVIHGWKHISHAPAGEKNAEFGHPRAEAAQELTQSLQNLEGQFGNMLVKMFVPPWNRISAELLPALAECGYTGLSTYGTRKALQPVHGLTQINTHIDPIYWRGDRGLVDPDTIIALLVQTLQARRENRTDPREPLGLLTHHLVHTEDVWAFSRDVIHELLNGGAIVADIRSILQADRNPNI